MAASQLNHSLTETLVHFLEVMESKKKKKKALTQDNTCFRESQRDNGNMNFGVRASTAKRENENPEAVGEHMRITHIMR